MSNPGSYKGVLKRIKKAPKEVRDYFYPLQELIKRYDYNIPLAYAFSVLETGQNRALYCGMSKLHRVHTEVAWKAIQIEHIHRSTFREMFATIIGKKVPQEIISLIEKAEKTRDKVMHGKNPKDAEMRKAIVDVIEYAEALNDFSEKVAGFKPFGPLRGFKGAGVPLEKSTSRLVVKGLGFNNFS